MDRHKAHARRVLVAEDNAANQLLVRTLLELHRGWVVDVAGSGVEAVEMWQVHRHDLGLFDIEMPLMDGLAAAAEIRQRSRRDGCIMLPVVGMTSRAIMLQDCLRAGMVGLVAKPLQADGLLLTLDYFMMWHMDKFETGYSFIANIG